MANSTPQTPTELFQLIERVLPEGGDWCSLDKAATLASLVVGLRPRMIVEIGVWSGGSMIPMLLALKHVGGGNAFAIDAWAPTASVVGQHDENAEWWGKVDHETAYQTFLRRLNEHQLAGICRTVRAPSSTVTPPDVIDLLHVDGNHGPQAIDDVRRFGTRVPVGGILVLDDVGWEGGHVLAAYDLARELGYQERFQLDTGVVLQRVALEGAKS